MRPEDIVPGAIIEWPHTPDFTVFSSLVVDRIENGYAWLHFKDTTTINRLSIPAILSRGRLALATGREVEWLKRLVRAYVDPFDIAPEDYAIVVALGTDDEEEYRAALEGERS